MRALFRQQIHSPPLRPPPFRNPPLPPTPTSSFYAHYKKHMLRASDMNLSDGEWRFRLMQPQAHEAGIFIFVCGCLETVFLCGSCTFYCVPIVYECSRRISFFIIVSACISFVVFRSVFLSSWHSCRTPQTLFHKQVYRKDLSPEAQPVPCKNTQNYNPP